MASAFDTDWKDSHTSRFDYFGESVTYTPNGGVGITRTIVLVRQPTRTEVGDEGEEEIKEILAEIRMNATTGVLAPAIEDSITIGAEIFLVVDITPDANGETADLRCESRKVAERSRSDYRTGGS